MQRQVKQLYASQAGGDPHFWRSRPLSDQAVEYAALDVQLLMELHYQLKTRLDSTWESKVLTVSYERLGEFRDLVEPVCGQTPQHTLSPAAFLPKKPNGSNSSRRKSHRTRR